MPERLEFAAALPPPHPGEVLREAYMVPLAPSAGRIAEACCAPRTRIEPLARDAA